MTQVTVGVPVYNGAAFLEKCLTCLRDQTYRDIEVLIFDNCSDDATPEIAQRFCAADPRFRYHRQPENKGVLRNFQELLAAAKSPLFMWRAADDTSDLNFIETLVTLLLNHPERDVAVSRIVSALPDGRITRVRRVSRLIGKGTEIDHIAQLFLTHESWIYGLYRREALTPIFLEVLADYSEPWGMDNLTLFVLAFDGKLIGSNATTFYQRLRYTDPAKRATSVHTKIERGRLFEAFAHRHVNRRVKKSAKRWYYHAVVSCYVHMRALSFRRSCAINSIIHGGFPKLRKACRDELKSWTRAAASGIQKQLVASRRATMLGVVLEADRSSVKKAVCIARILC